MNANFNLNDLDSVANRLYNEFLSKEQKIYPFAKKKLASMIDHTLLKPEATEEEVIKICDEAKKYLFASVCINPSYVSLSKKIIGNIAVKICTVIGFPLGATTTEVKKYEAEQAIINGADEIDMVINVGKLKQKDYEYILNDIKSVADIANKNDKTCKVIIETALLSDEEKIRACIIAKEAGAGFVKTSTGFSKSGANVKDIALMRFVVGEEIGVKASGGVRTFEDAKKMIESGANRIGASASIQIINESENS